MKKWEGSFTAFEDDFSLTESHESLDDIVVTDKHISLDWHDDWGKYNVILHPTDDDGYEIWRGDITCSTDQSTCGQITAVRYDLKGGGVVLIVKWIQNGYEGIGMYEILRA